MFSSEMLLCEMKGFPFPEATGEGELWWPWGLPGCRRKRAELASLSTEGAVAPGSGHPEIPPASRAPSYRLLHFRIV